MCRAARPEQYLSGVTRRDLLTIGLFPVARWVWWQGRRLCPTNETHQFIVGLEYGVCRSDVELPVVQGENPFEECIPVFIEIPGIGFRAALVGRFHVLLGRVKLFEWQFAISGPLKKPGDVHRTRQAGKMFPASETEADCCQRGMEFQRTCTGRFTWQREQHCARMMTLGPIAMRSGAGHVGHAKEAGP